MKRVVILALSCSILFSFTFMVIDDNLIAHWAMDGNAEDATEHQLNGKVMGDPQIVLSANGSTALEFDGDDYIEIETTESNSKHIKSLSKGSISLWFKAYDWDVQNSIQPIFYYGGKEPCDVKISGDNTGTVIQIGHGGMFPSESLFFTFYDESCSYPAMCYDTNKDDGKIENNKWYHFVGVVGENFNTGFLNGKELVDRHYNFKDESYATFFDDHVNYETIWIGKSIWMNEEKYFNGIIDDIRIYSHAMSQQEAESLYNQGMTEGQTKH